MVLWFAALSVAGTFLVFRDPALDYRLVAVGALLPDPLDGLIRRGVGPFHSLVTAVAVLVVVMLATIGRRSVRRRGLAVVIGIFAHLVLDAMWARTKVFWWPIASTAFRGRLPVLDRPIGLLMIEELVGAGVAMWLWRQFGLADATRRAKFLRTGRLDRSMVQ